MIEWLGEHFLSWSFDKEFQIEFRLALKIFETDLEIFVVENYLDAIIKPVPIRFIFLGIQHIGVIYS